MRSFAVDGTTAVITLRADQRKLADQLRQKYGSRLRVVLGNFAYPNLASTRQEAFCAPVPSPGPTNKSLRWTASPSTMSVNSGADLKVDVTFTNQSSTTVRFRAGDPITGIVTTKGTPKTVATYDAYLDTVPRSGTLREGEKFRVIAMISTASCQPKLGWALPAGTYDVRFAFGGYDFTASGGAKADQFVSTPMSLTVK